MRYWGGPAMEWCFEVRQLVRIVKLGSTDERECAQNVVELVRMAREYFGEASMLGFHCFH